MFLYRIYPVAQLRLFLKFAIAFAICFGTVAVIVNIFPCTSIHDFWDFLGGYVPGPRKCINVHTFYLAGNAVNTVLDFVLLVLVSDLKIHLGNIDTISNSQYRWFGGFIQPNSRSLC